MKKITSILLVLVMAFSLASCTGEEVAQEKQVPKITTIEQLEEIISKDVTDTNAKLVADQETLVANVDTYEKYETNINKVQDFYNQIIKETNDITIRMREYSIIYVEIVMSSDMSYKDKDKAIDDMYDLICDDAFEDIYDGICDDLMEDMYSAFYSGVVEDGYDYVPYKKWSDVLSQAYDMYSDCSSEVYDIWSDASSDIYEFWSDVSSAMWDGDEAEIEDEIKKLKGDIDKLKNPEKAA